MARRRKICRRKVGKCAEEGRKICSQKVEWEAAVEEIYFVDGK